jgi:hypothetical protein
MSNLKKELSVIEEVAAIMEGLDQDQQRRVLMWLEDYFDVFGDGNTEEDSDDVSYDSIQPAALPEATSAVEESEEELDEVAEVEPDTFETLFDRVAPKTAIQKIVVAAYWLQTREGEQQWKSFSTNKLLKSLGVKISSVSGTLALEGKKDEPLVEMMSKAGDSMQARKTYRLSEAGIKFVENRLA